MIARALALVVLTAIVACAHPGDSSHALAALGEAQTCTFSTDCQGRLPQSCPVCSDGKSVCAHWECVHGACEIATCAADAGMAGR